MSDLFISPKRKQTFQVQCRKPDLNKGPQRLTMEEQNKIEQSNLPKYKWKRKSPLSELSTEEKKLHRKSIIHIQLLLDSKNVEYLDYDDKLQLIKRLRRNNVVVNES